MNYQLIDNNEKVFATLSDPNWVKIDREGKKIFSFWEDANAVYYKNTFYTIMGRFIPEAAKDYETIYVGILDDRSLLTELESTQMWNNLVCGGGTNGNRMQMIDEIKEIFFIFVEKYIGNDLEKALKFPDFIKEFSINYDYIAGDLFTFDLNKVGDPMIYMVKENHRSKYLEWPPLFPEYYQPIGCDEYEVPEWREPVGANDRYDKDDVVCKEGNYYRSLIEENGFPTDCDYWEKLGEEEIKKIQNENIKIFNLRKSEKEEKSNLKKY